MPEICRFYGIIIAMFYNEHERPHFHAKYAEDAAQISLPDLEIIEGKLPVRALRLVREWAEAYKEELMEMYISKNITKLKPLL